ncbi:hypothetical protein [Gordonia sputi]
MTAQTLTTTSAGASPAVHDNQDDVSAGPLLPVDDHFYAARRISVTAGPVR